VVRDQQPHAEGKLDHLRVRPNHVALPRVCTSRAPGGGQGIEAAAPNSGDTTRLTRFAGDRAAKRDRSLAPGPGSLPDQGIWASDKRVHCGDAGTRAVRRRYRLTLAYELGMGFEAGPEPPVALSPRDYGPRALDRVGEHQAPGRHMKISFVSAT